MRAVVSQRAAEQLAAAPDKVARTFFKQLAHLLRDRNHPSLDAKNTWFSVPPRQKCAGSYALSK